MGMPSVTVPKGRRLVIEAGLFLGVAVAALLHGIVLQELLGASRGPELAPTARELFYNGLVALAALTCIGASIALLMKARARLDTPRVPRRLVGALLVGIGGYVAVEGLFVHILLGAHRTYVGDGTLLWESGYVLVGVTLAGIGLLVLRRVADEAHRHEQTLWPAPRARPPARSLPSRETGLGGLNRR